MSQPIPTMTSLFRTSLRAWQAHWKATQGRPVTEALPAEADSAATTQESEPTTKVKRRRKRSGRTEHGPVAKRV